MSLDRNFLATTIAGSTAACFAELCSIPFDTAKVRMQLQGSASASNAVPYKSIFDALRRIPSEEGPRALFRGLTPGFHRQIVFAGLRIGLYQHIRDFYHGGSGEPTLMEKILAGLTTGALGITYANPTDVVKIRMQAEGRLPPGVPRTYKDAADAYLKIVKQDGLVGLWRGYAPNVLRNSLICAAELASYDQIKQYVLKSGVLNDGVPAHLLSGLGAGFIATIVGSPIDVIKTRVMNAKGGISVFEIISQLVKNEGPSAFYKGFWANFTRIGSWNVLMFLSFEQLKKLL